MNLVELMVDVRWSVVDLKHRLRLSRGPRRPLIQHEVICQGLRNAVAEPCLRADKEKP